MICTKVIKAGHKCHPASAIQQVPAEAAHGGVRAMGGCRAGSAQGTCGKTEQVHYACATCESAAPSVKKRLREADPSAGGGTPGQDSLRHAGAAAPTEEPCSSPLANHALRVKPRAVTARRRQPAWRAAAQFCSRVFL